MANERHNYEYEVDPLSNTAPAHVVRLVGSGKRVLELGCGPGSITRLLTEQGRCRVTAMERDPEAISKARPYCEQVFQVDLDTKDWAVLLRDIDHFDAVVAADVLEHLYDPWSVLEGMGRLVASSGYLVVSLPHVAHAAVTGCLVQGDFSYRDWGLLDRTHIRFFCLKNIEELFAQAGLKIVEAHYVRKPPEETEFAAVWASLAPNVQAALRTSPHSDVYQVVVKAVPLVAAGEPVRLVPAPVQSTAVIRSRWRSRISAHFPPAARKKIRSAISAFGWN